MKQLLLAVTLASVSPAALIIAASAPAAAEQRCNEWGQCWWERNPAEEIIGGVMRGVMPRGEHRDRHWDHDRIDRRGWDHDRWMRGGYRGRHWHHHDEEEGD